MPNISMCQHKTCPLRFDCLRQQAQPSARQTYGEFSPRPHMSWQEIELHALGCHIPVTCDGYMPITPRPGPVDEAGQDAQEHPLPGEREER